MKYKILIVSDNEILKKYTIKQMKENFKEIDFIISAGDVSNDYLDYIFSVLDKDIIYINGNHVYNSSHSIGFCKKLDGKIITYKGIRIAGFDGSRVYNFKEHQYTEKQMFFKILRILPKILIKKPEIVISHSPPRGIHDKEDNVHKGFNIFIKFIKFFKPKIWIHGHVHLQHHHEIQESIFMDTKVINAYGYKVIEFEK